MYRTAVLLSLCLVVVVTASAQDYDDIENNKWDNEGWYDDDLENLGIFSHESDQSNNELVADQNVPENDDTFNEKDANDDKFYQNDENDIKSEETADIDEIIDDQQSDNEDYGEIADEQQMDGIGDHEIADQDQELDDNKNDEIVDDEQSEKIDNDENLKNQPINNNGDDDIVDDQQLDNNANDDDQQLINSDNDKMVGIGENEIADQDQELDDNKNDEIVDDKQSEKIDNDENLKNQPIDNNGDIVDDQQLENSGNDNNVDEYIKLVNDQLVDKKDDDNVDDIGDENAIIDLKIEKEIDHFLKQEKEITAIKENDEFNDNDYQVEDNRSGVQNKIAENNEDVAEQSNEQIFEETKDLLEAEDSQMNIDDIAESNLGKIDDEEENNNGDVDILNKHNIEQVKEPEIKYVRKDQDDLDSSNQDAVAEAVDDLKDDIEQLFETMNKLTDNKDSPVDDQIEEENVSDYEDNDAPPLRARDDYEDAELPADDNKDDYDLIDDIVVKSDGNLEEVKAEETKDEINNKIVEQVPYINDAIQDHNKAEENPDNMNEVDVDFSIYTNKNKDTVDQPDEISSSELNDLMVQFKTDHSDDLDTESVNFDKNVAPIFINLKVDEPVTITSPNYPGAYPTNNIIDWVIDGEGMGIEMNVTDLGLNGILGDYLLVKPGGVDESGTDGLIFSYRLKSVRKYRFLDVNRMFIRFEAKAGMSLPANQGFSLSVKLIAPLPAVLEPVPDPEPVVDPPKHVMEVYLGGLTQNEFVNVSEEFRLIIADMATVYINYHDIDIGDTNTADVVQITRVSRCNINWHGFERCAGVTFGVPLGTADDELNSDQLEDMWRRYRAVDPFAARLRRLGIVDFAVPDDSSTLVVWLVICLGVAFSVGMLALALWRWSCYEDYTRMPAFSDTDSVLGDPKRGLDLYPTPHQTIPPLYDDNFIKYEDTARVDMGGFANRSFAPGGMYDLDSDDDVIGIKKSRSNNIQPKDIYQI